MPVETLLSRIAGKARRKPVSTATPTPRPWRSSSRVRSKMSTLASTAIRSDAGGEVAVPDRGEGAAEAGLHGDADATAVAQLITGTFEDEHVGVDGHPI